MHTANRLAKCRVCDEIFRTFPGGAVPRARQCAPSDTIRNPAGVWIDESHGSRIIRDRNGCATVGLFILVTVWLAFAGTCGGMMAVGDKDGPTLFPILIVVLLVLATLGMFYLVLIHFLDRQVVEIADGELRASFEGPIPCWGNMKLDLRSIQQFYLQQVLYHGDGTTEGADLHALLTDGSFRKVLRGLSQHDAQFYVEHLNHWLESASSRPGNLVINHNKQNPAASAQQ
jgi:hypothetical protein